MIAMSPAAKVPSPSDQLKAKLGIAKPSAKIAGKQSQNSCKFSKHNSRSKCLAIEKVPNLAVAGAKDGKREQAVKKARTSRALHTGILMK